MRVLGRTSLLLVISVSVLLLAVQFNFSPVFGDEGILAMDGWRIFRGEVPHRDFFQFIPPLAAYVQAAFFKVFSPSVFSVRLLGLLYGIILLVLSFFLFRRFLKHPAFLALSLSLIVPFGVGGWLFGSHHWLCAILQLAAAVTMLAGFEKGAYKPFILAGTLLGMSAFVLQDQGAYAVLGLTAASFLLAGRERKLLAVSAVSAVLVFCFAAVPFAWLASPGQLAADWVRFPLFNYKAAGGNQFSLSNFAGRLASSWDLQVIRIAPFYGLGSAICSSFLFLSPVLSMFSLAFCLIKKVLPRRDSVVLTVFTLTFLLGAFHRLALTNLGWAFPAFLPFYIALESGWTGSRAWIKRLCVAVASLLLLSSISFSIARITLCLDREKAHTVSGPAGSYSLFNPREAQSIQELIDETANRVPEGEPMFCVGYSPLMNFLTLHPNPTRFNFMIPGGYYSGEQIKSWLLDLENRKVGWGIGEKPFVTAGSARSLFPRFEAVFENDKYILFKRKEREP